MSSGGLAWRLALAPVLLTLAACAAEETQAVPAATPQGDPVAVPDEVRRVLHLDFEGRAAAPGAVVPSVRNAMSRPVSVTVSTADDGRAVVAEGPNGEGGAVRLPAYQPSGPVTAAVLVVRATGQYDSLEPNRRDFRFGATFRLDEVSDGTEADDGDNLVQRGMFDDEVQYKLQIDDGRPSCLVRGADGEVIVKVEGTVEREVWYVARCTRSAGGVTLTLDRADGSGGTTRAQSRGPTGRMRFESAVPMTVGGKVDDEGNVTISSSDQFNGAVDDVFLEYPR